MARKPRVSTAFLALMEASEHHAWTLEELRSGLAGVGIAADFSSIYRAAEKLAAGGTVVKIVLDDGRARFELVGAHHDHLHCTGCDALVPVPCVIDRAAFSALEARTGIAISAHSIVLSGLCWNCRAASAGHP